MLNFTKKCGNENCENIQTFKTKDGLKNAIKTNTKCRKCATKKTEEHKKKISEAQKKYWSTTTQEDHFGGPEKYKEIRFKQGSALRGKKRPPFTDEWKAKMSETRKNSEVYQNWMKSDEYRERRRKIAVENWHDDITYEEWLEKTDEREVYYAQVWFHTEKQPLKILENFDKRSEHSKNPDAYHLDHIISISYGFKKQIPPEIIGNIENLRFIPWIKNLQKGSKNEGSPEELIRKVNNNSTGDS